MRMITRTLAVATISAMVGGIGLTASAQPAGPGSAPPVTQDQTGQAARATPGHHRRDPVEHLKALHTEIGITAAQDPAWDNYAKAVQNAATQMRAGRDGGGRHTFLEMSTQDRLALLMKRRDQREQAMNSVKAAADALLPVLTDTQKVRALLALPGLSSHGMMMNHHGMKRMHG